MAKKRRHQRTPKPGREGASVVDVQKVRSLADRITFRIPRFIDGEAEGPFAISALIVVVAFRFTLAAILTSLAVWTTARLF